MVKEHASEVVDAGGGYGGIRGHEEGAEGGWIFEVKEGEVDSERLTVTVDFPPQGCSAGDDFVSEFCQVDFLNKFPSRGEYLPTGAEVFFEHFWMVPGDWDSEGSGRGSTEDGSAEGFKGSDGGGVDFWFSIFWECGGFRVRWKEAWRFLG